MTTNNTTRRVRCKLTECEYDAAVRMQTNGTSITRITRKIGSCTPQTMKKYLSKRKSQLIFHRYNERWCSNCSQYVPIEKFGWTSSGNLSSRCNGCDTKRKQNGRPKTITITQGEYDELMHIKMKYQLLQDSERRKAMSEMGMFKRREK